MAKVTSETLERRVKVGVTLQRQREKLGLSKVDITRYVGYKNANFISKLEKGEALLPIGKFCEFVEVYKLPKDYILLIFRELYPDAWDFVSDFFAGCFDNDKEEK